MADQRVMPGRQPRRVRTLDGLRGVAALAVVFHHTLLSSSASLARQYAPVGDGRSPATGSSVWFLARTPLHILWAGPEMVLVFFVLSGYVLALPSVTRGWGWFDVAYYPRRFIRLYLPVFAALVLGVALHELHHGQLTGATYWLNEHAVAATLADAARNASLVGATGRSGMAFTTVLWSLRYEVLFSAALPLLLIPVLATRDAPRAALVLAAGCLLLAAVGAQRDVMGLRLMPLFVLGSLLAMHRDRLGSRGWVTAAPLRRLISAVLGLIAIFLITNCYVFSDRAWNSVAALSYVGVVVGCCLAVAVLSTGKGWALERRPAQWLGSRSYSLYLVHEPIVVVVAFAVGAHRAALGSATTIVVLLLSLPLSLLTAEAFWRLVERPGLRLARAAGAAISARVGPQVARFAVSAYTAHVDR